jgi:hypothetical protein
MASDDRSITQRTLDLLKDEWTKPYRTALEEITAVLGTGRCEKPNCAGCIEERAEAIRIATTTLAIEETGTDA